MKFTIDIGDWADNGHGRREVYFAAADTEDIEEIREAYFTASSKYPMLRPSSFCAEHGDYEVPEDVIADANELGFNIYADDFGPGEMAEYVIWFLNLGNPSLNVTAVEGDVPSLHFPGSDSKGRHINRFGYGILSPA